MFKFRLQRVLELREKREEAQAIQFARAEATASMARTERDELQALRTQSREQITTANSSAPTVGHLHHLGFVLSALDQRLEQAAQVVSKAEGMASEARASLELAARDRRVLHRLKDKHSDVHRAGEAHRDRVQMDEIALSLYTRQRLAEKRENAEAGQENEATVTIQFPGGAAEA